MFAEDNDDDLIDYHDAAVDAARTMSIEGPIGAKYIEDFLYRSLQHGMAIMEFDRHGMTGVLHICFRETEERIKSYTRVAPVAQITWPTSVHDLASAQVAIALHSDMLVLASTVVHQLKSQPIVDKKLTTEELKRTGNGRVEM